MKKMMVLSCLMLFLSPMAWCQEKIETPPEYKVGDKWEWKWTKGREGYSWSNKVIEVKEDEIIAVTTRGNKLFLDRQYNVLKAINPKGEDVTHNFWWERWFWLKEFPLYPGRRWSQTQKGGFFTRGLRFEQEYDIECLVERLEKVKVPAGEFNAFKIMVIATTEDETGRGKINPKVTLWYSTDTKSYIKGVWGEKYWYPQSWQGAEFKLIKFESGN